MNQIVFTAWVLLFPAACTTLGAAGVFLLRWQSRPCTQRILCGMAAGIMLAASVWSLLLPAIERAEQGPLMIPLYGTMIAMTGPHTLPWVCTSSMALWTSSCGNGSCASRNFTPGRSPGRNTLNGKSTGRVPAMTANGLTTMFLGEKKNRTSKAALLNLSFSRAACLPFAIILLCGRVETNSINPVSQGKVTGQKPCIHAGLSRFDGYSHSIVAGGLDVIS